MTTDKNAATSSLEATILSGLSLLLLISQVVAFTLIQERRELQPIKAKQPKLIRTTIVAVGVLTLLVGFLFKLGPGNIPCPLEILTDYLFVTVLGGVYTVRGFVMYFKFEMIHQKVDLHVKAFKLATETRKVSLFAASETKSNTITTEDISESVGGSKSGGVKEGHRSNGDAAEHAKLVRQQIEKRTFYLVNKKYITRRFQMGIFSMILFFGLIPAWVEIPGSFGAKASSWSCTDVLLSNNYQHSIGMTLVQVLLVSSVAFWSKKLRQPDFADNFGAQKEFVVTLIVTSTLLLCSGILQIVFRDIAFPLRLTFFLIILFFITCYTAFHPLVVSQLRQSQSHRASDVTLKDGTKISLTEALRNFLQHPLGLQTFSEYAKRQFCMENVLFYCEVNRFVESSQRLADKTGVSAVAMILEDAIRIYTIFLRDSAPLQVNVPFHMVDALKSSLMISRDEPSAAASISDLFNGKNVEKILAYNEDDEFMNSGSHTEIGVALPSEHTRSISRTTRVSLAPARRNIAKIKLPEGVELNLSGRDLKSPEALRSLIHSFDACQGEILTLMARDLFRMFRQKQAYQDVLHEVEAQRTALKHAQME